MKDYKNLMTIASDQLDLGSQLLLATRAQRSAIISGDVTRLAQLMERVDDIVLRIRRSEAEAGAILGDGGLEEALEAMRSGERAQFEEIRSKTIELLDEVASANAANAGLLEDALYYIENTVRLIAGSDGASSVYSRLGMVDKRAASAAVDETA